MKYYFTAKISKGLYTSYLDYNALCYTANFIVVPPKVHKTVCISTSAMAHFNLDNNDMYVVMMISRCQLSAEDRERIQRAD